MYFLLLDCCALALTPLHSLYSHTDNLLQKKRSASAQAALKLQLHSLFSSTVLLQTGTSVPLLGGDFSAPDAISLTEHNFIVKCLIALAYGWS